jgi:hypothetical protein
MSIELKGKLIKLLDMQTGEGRNGPWKKREFVIEMPGQYPKKVCITTWGDKTSDLANLNEGDELKVSVDIESREWNGRWFTDVKAWRIEKESSGGGGAAPADQPPMPDEEPFDPDGGNDDLPF